MQLLIYYAFIATPLIALAVYSAISTFVAWRRLRHFPTPSPFAPFTRLWIAFISHSGRQYWVHRRWHQKYGPIVRIGPNELVTNDRDIVKYVNSSKSGYHRGSYYQTGRFNPYHGNILSMTVPEEHRKAKAVTAPIYGGRTRQVLERCVDEQIETLIRILRQRYVTDSACPPLLDLMSITNFFTVDAITSMAFGRALGDMEDGVDHYDLLQSIHDLWPWMVTVADLPWLRSIIFSPWFLKLLGPKPSDKKGFGALMRVARDLVAERFDSSTKDSDDMLGCLKSRGFTQGECEAEGLFLLMSGAESTACCIRAILLHTITSPTVYQKLKCEITTAVQSNAVSHPATLEELKKLPYVQAVIYEGIRMRPPLLGLWPKVVPAGGATFLGQHVPAGTAICTNTSALLASPALFGVDADVFRPERFMELSPDLRAEMERNVELAFGHGQWACAGKIIAQMEMVKMVFEMFRNFDMQMAFPFNPRKVESYGVFLEEGMFVRISNCQRNAMVGDSCGV